MFVWQVGLGRAQAQVFLPPAKFLSISFKPSDSKKKMILCLTCKMLFNTEGFAVALSILSCVSRGSLVIQVAINRNDSHSANSSAVNFCRITLQAFTSQSKAFGGAGWGGEWDVCTTFHPAAEKLGPVFCSLSNSRCEGTIQRGSVGSAKGHRPSPAL